MLNPLYIAVTTESMRMIGLKFLVCTMVTKGFSFILPHQGSVPDKLITALFAFLSMLSC